MNISIQDSYEGVSTAAAGEISRMIEAKPGCVLGLATGTSPLGAYKGLIERHRKGLDFSRVTTFNLDEYRGLSRQSDIPYTRDQSYARFMWEEFFRHVNIREDRIHLLDGRAADPESHCLGYEEQIRKAGGIDLQILGIGRTGHLAFNEPGSPLDSRTRLVDLSRATLDDNYDLFFKHSGRRRDEMPTQALTQGIGTIMEARSLLILASGSHKSSIIQRALEGEVTPDVPASVVQTFEGPVTVILDRESAAGLKHRT